MVNDDPLVSVLMTAYNREEYIAEAIESVLASTYRNFELIIVDDSSKDETVNIARSFQQRDKRVFVHINEKNLGQFPNRNKAAELAQGKYILYVDSDDTIFTDGIERLVENMESHTEASFAMYAPDSKMVTLIPAKDSVRKHFFEKPFLGMGPGGTMIRLSFFKEIGKYPVDYGIPGDMYFNLKACSYSPVVLIPFQFVSYRRHKGQEINNAYDYLYNNYKYMKDALLNLPLGLKPEEIQWLLKKAKRRFVVNITRYFLHTWDFPKTKNALKKAGFSYGDAVAGIFHIN